MAIISTIADDFDGSTPAETVTFHVNGQGYQIDLGEENRAELDSLLSDFEKKMDKFIDAGRPLSAPRTTARRASSPSSGPSYDAGKVREWAAENGIEVAPRGRISREVLDAYQDRNKKK